jgi:hypothetical protein
MDVTVKDWGKEQVAEKHGVSVLQLTGGSFKKI